MKKQLLLTGAAILGVGLLAGCGGSKKAPSISEIIDANRELVAEADDIGAEFSMEFEVSISSSSLALYAGSDEIGAKGSIEGEKSGKVSHANIKMDVNAGSESQSIDAEFWDDTKKSYVSVENLWYSMDSETSESADDADYDDLAEVIQDAIDDGDATLEEKKGDYVLTYEMPFSDLAELDDVSELSSLGLSTSDLKKLDGAVVIKGKFDGDTLYFKELEIYIDDDGKESVCKLFSAFLPDLEVKEAYLSISAEYDTDPDSLKIPSDVKDDAIDTNGGFNMSDLMTGGSSSSIGDGSSYGGDPVSADTVESKWGSENDLTYSVGDGTTYSKIMGYASGNDVALEYTYSVNVEVTDELTLQFQESLTDEVFKQEFETIKKEAGVYPDYLSISFYSADGTSVYYDYRFYSDLY